MNIKNLFNSKKVVYSLEVFPPKKTNSIDTIYNTLYGLRGLPVDFISVTYGAGGSDTQQNKTCEIASLIKSEYNIEPVSHLTCSNSTKEDIINTLDRLKENKIQNILALRGDKSEIVIPKNDFKYASDLVKFIKEYDSSFNVLGACYPECHFESDTIEKDIENLKKKIDAGVSSLITQLFFDNEHLYEFMDKLQKANINIPVEAGIMPIVSKNQIERIVLMCGASLPRPLTKILNKYADDATALKDAGIYYATSQIIDLVANDVRGIHLYTMNNVDVATDITNSIKNIITFSNKQ